MRHSVEGFSFVLLWNPNVDHDSVESLLSMRLLPGKHSSDNSPDVVVRPSRMSWGLILATERSRLEFCLRPRDNSGLCPRNDRTVSSLHDHLHPLQSLLRYVTRH